MSQTFSQKQINKLTHEAAAIKKRVWMDILEKIQNLGSIEVNDRLTKS